MGYTSLQKTDATLKSDKFFLQSDASEGESGVGTVKLQYETEYSFIYNIMYNLSPVAFPLPS